MSEMDKKYSVTEKTAELLEKLGFSWRHKPFATRIGNMVYNQVALDDQLPTLEEAQRWLREVKHEVVLVDAKAIDIYTVHILGRNGSTKLFRTYEAALEEGINLVAKILIKNHGR
jgi:hypothetical protein